MSFKNKDLINLVGKIELGNSVAEEDTLLEETRIETSVFNDLLNDRVDLIPGTKGSGKSALYRIFVEFLAKPLLNQKKVIIAYGVNKQGDVVFHAFKKEFEKLSEDDLINFWCVYLVSLAHEQFLKNHNYERLLSKFQEEIKKFKLACHNAKIPEIKGKKNLKEVIEWSLNAIKQIRPTFSITTPEQTRFELIFEKQENKNVKEEKSSGFKLPLYVEEIKTSLDNILTKSDLNLWLMIDKLDEIFPRRTDLEKKALRALLRVIKIFSSSRIKIKVFLRDDILNDIVKSKEGFTALDHITSKQSDTLRWDKNQILDLVLKRFLSNTILSRMIDADSEKVASSQTYRKKVFYKIFPKSVNKGKRQSDTISWLYARVADGNNVVTPRDIIYLLTSSIKKQFDLLKKEPQGKSEIIINPEAIKYGHDQLSLYKVTTFLKAEFPHIWKNIEKLSGKKAELSLSSLRKNYGKGYQKVISDLISIGVLSKRKNKYIIPFLYRKGLGVTQGKA